MSSDSSSTSSLMRASVTSHSEPELKGWLYKWANYLKGYQKRWFVLNNGTISYYRNPMEMSQSCRGSINLVSAVFHAEDSLHFLVANGGTQTFHLRASNEAERNKWVNALELAKVRAIRQMDADDEDDFYDLAADKLEVQSMLKGLQSKLDTLTTNFNVVVKRGNSLQRSLIELEQIDNPTEALARSKAINERATLFRITSSALINAGVDYLNFAQTHSKKVQKILHHEHESRIKLEELVEQLAKQHSHLEQRAIEQHLSVSDHSAFTRRTDDNTEDDEFYDAEENTAEFVVTFPGKAHRIHSTPTAQSTPNSTNCSNNSEKHSSETGERRQKKRRRKRPNKPSSSQHDSSNSNDEEEDREDDDGEIYSSEEDNDNIMIDVVTRKSLTSTSNEVKVERADSSAGNALHNGVVKSGQRQRRTHIPPRPNHSLNLWSIMKNCIGKELTKIPMPVNFNEPLSMLQRMTEEFEYSEILHKAAKIEDPTEQMAYVAAFSVTCYATTSNRTSKPFNPLLGETYECDRTDDLGWRCVSEQVSHHPPMLAQYCEGRDWVCWREFAMTSKFRGKYLRVDPIDITHLEFPSSGHHYTWRKVSTTVHNIIVGKLWVDNHGEMTITNHKTGDLCHLNFPAYSYFSRDTPRKVTGLVVNKDEEIKWVLNGTWDAKMETCKVLNSTQKGGKGTKPMVETGTPRLIWKRNLPPPEYEKMYNMTVLAVQLNEIEEGVAPTDSRLRPDQRLMEEANWDEANEVKARLEDKQRATRRQREEEAERAATEGRPYMPYEPAWFKKGKDPITGNPVHMYTQEYWQCKERQEWSRCPQIYID